MLLSWLKFPLTGSWMVVGWLYHSVTSYFWTILLSVISSRKEKNPRGLFRIVSLFKRGLFQKGLFEEAFLQRLFWRSLYEGRPFWKGLFGIGPFVREDFLMYDPLKYLRKTFTWFSWLDWIKRICILELFKWLIIEFKVTWMQAC